MSQSQRGGNGFAAGPPQGEMHPLGGQRSTRSGEGGGNGFAAGPPQGETSPLGGQRSTRSGERGGNGFAAGPPQGETSPLGGQRSTRSGERGSNGFAAGPPQGETRPLGGQRSTRSGKRGGNIVFFDLDHTLLTGDSDVLWCDFLIAQGLLDTAGFGAQNADMDARYRAGTVGLDEFANFYVGTLAGRSPQDWEPLRQRFLQDVIVPRIPPSALALVKQHQAAGDLVVMTTATNRFITELTAKHIGIEHLIATEPAVANGIFTGHTTGTLNMREGKVTRLHAWLQARDQALDQFESSAYSDSINDLPLLSAVQRPVAVDPDARLRQEAMQRGWQILELVR